MMGKINVDKTGSFEPIRPDRQIEVRKPVRETKQPQQIKNPVNDDRLDFSSWASEVGKLVEHLKKLPDVRQDKVDSLRDQISAGDYKPSSDKIADAILKDEKI